MLKEVIQSSRIEAEERVAEIIGQKLHAFVEQKGKAVLAVCGGRSISRILELLAKQKLPWQNIHFFMVDERCVSIVDPESNYKLVYESCIKTLIDAKKLPPLNVHPFRYNASHPEKSLAAYTQELKKQGDFDIVLLSSGEDGHTAALYPDHHSIENTSKGFMLMHDSPKPPSKRMTSTKKLIQAASVGIMLFFGPEKERAWQRFNDTVLPLEACPAKLVLSLKEAYAVRA